MFRSVQVFGPVEQVPGLRERIEAVTPLLAEELKSSADRITLLWNLRPTDPGHGVLEFELTDHLFGRELQYLDPDTFDRDARGLRRQVRWMHVQILNAYLDRRVEEYKRHLAEPVEV